MTFSRNNKASSSDQPKQEEFLIDITFDSSEDNSTSEDNQTQLHITPPQATSIPVSTQPRFLYFGVARRIRSTFADWGTKGKTDNLEGDLEDPNPTQPHLELTLFQN